MTTTPRRFRVGFAHPGTLHYDYCADLVKRKLDAEVRPDLFVTAWDNSRHSPTFGRTVGLVGLTGADDGPLPSERNLARPVEQECAGLAGWAVRRRVAEVGPLTAFQAGAEAFLVRNLPTVAIRQGYDFLLATLTADQHYLAEAAGWDFHTLAGGPERTGIVRCSGVDALPIAG